MIQNISVEPVFLAPYPRHPILGNFTVAQPGFVHNVVWGSKLASYSMVGCTINVVRYPMNVERYPINVVRYPRSNL